MTKQRKQLYQQQESTPLRFVSILILTAFLAACSSNPSVVDEPETAQQSSSQEIDDLLAAASSLTGLAAVEARIAAIELLIERNEIQRAETLLPAPRNLRSLPPTLNSRVTLARARIALMKDEPEVAVSILNSAPDTPSQPAEYYLLLGDTLLTLGRPIDAFRRYTENTSNLADISFSAELHDAAWSALEKIEAAELSALAGAATSYSNRGWLELARAVTGQEISVQGQLDAIAQWQRVWSNHEAAKLLPSQLTRLRQNWEGRPRQVALILPLKQQAGKAIEEGFLSAYYHSLEQGLDAPKITFYDSSELTNIYPVYDEAVDAGADLIIGPLSKDLVQQLHRLPDLPVPTLALNYADDAALAPEEFFQFGLAPENEIQQAVELAADSGYKNAAVIMPTGSDYLRLNNIFEKEWASAGGVVVSRSTFDGDSSYGELIRQAMAIDASEARADRIEDLLPRNQIEFVPRRRQDIDFIYLIANPRQGRQIRPTLAFYFAESLPVIAYPSIYDGSKNADTNRDLDGIVLLDSPWLLESSDPVKRIADENLRSTAGPLQRLRALGVDSYRLHDRLTQFSETEITTLRGTTGVLTINQNREVRRQLLAAKFVDGLPQLLAAPRKLP